MNPKAEMVERLLDFAARGDVEKVTSMISNSSFLINKCNENGWTAVMFAARNGHFDVVKALLAKG